MKWIVILALLGVVFAGLIWAHGHLDSRPDRGAEAPSVLDAGPAYTRLMNEGIVAAEAARDSLLGQGFDDDARRLFEFMPGAGEPWMAEVEKLLADPPQPPYVYDEKPTIVEPRGLMTARAPVAYILRKLPGKMRVKVIPVGGVGDILEVDAAIGQRVVFPDKLLPGTEYRVTVEDVKVPSGVLAEGRVTTLTPEAALAYRERLLLLKRHVPTLAARVYAQASLAMSGGLYTEAADILIRHKPPEGLSGDMRGVQARRVFLYHHFHDWQRRDFVLRAMRP